jgi:hypothetical protein
MMLCTVVTSGDIPQELSVACGNHVVHCRDVYAIGSSGGALAGGLLFVPELSLDDMVNFIGECCDDCRSSIWNRFKVSSHIATSCPPMPDVLSSSIKPIGNCS